MKIKKLSILALVLVMVMALGACASTATTAATTAPAAAETTAAAATTAAPATAGGAEIAIILKTVSSPFWQSMQDGINKKLLNSASKSTSSQPTPKMTFRASSTSLKMPSTKAPTKRSASPRFPRTT